MGADQQILGVFVEVVDGDKRAGHLDGTAEVAGGEFGGGGLVQQLRNDICWSVFD